LGHLLRVDRTGGDSNCRLTGLLVGHINPGGGQGIRNRVQPGIVPVGRRGLLPYSCSIFLWLSNKVINLIKFFVRHVKRGVMGG
jgi:hypothetical protein